MTTREDILARLAAGLDMPPEVLEELADQGRHWHELADAQRAELIAHAEAVAERLGLTFDTTPLLEE